MSLMNLKRVLITGSSGTIGTALYRSLDKNGVDCVPVDNAGNRWDKDLNKKTISVDLTDQANMEQLPSDVDLIVHLAAHARVHKSVGSPTLAKENLNMTFNVLEHARKNNIDLIFASSREVYGDENSIVHSERDTYVDICESPYTASKVGGEALVKSYHECYDIGSSILRFSNVYGRFDASNRVVPLFISQARRGQNLVVYGEHKILDFTYLDDCIDGIERAINSFHKANGETFNIASGDGTSIIELAEYVRELTDASIDIQIEPSRTGEISKYIADISKSRAVLDYTPSYGIREGLHETVDWYDSNDSTYDLILSR